MSIQLWVVLGVVIAAVGIIIEALRHYETKRERDMSEYRHDLRTLDEKRERDMSDFRHDLASLDAKREADWRVLAATISKIDASYAEMSGRLSIIWPLIKNPS